MDERVIELLTTLLNSANDLMSLHADKLRLEIEGLKRLAPLQPVITPPVVIPSSIPDDFTRFKKFMPFVLARENAFDKEGNVTWEDVPGDDGGVTKYGIDQRSHLGVDIKNLTLEGALKIYYGEWLDHKCNLLPSPIAEVAFDAFVTGGRPVQWLQDILGVSQDGILGNGTVTAASASDHGKTALAMIERRDVYFNRVADAHANDKQFLKGWLNRNAQLRDYIQKTA